MDIRFIGRCYPVSLCGDNKQGFTGQQPKNTPKNSGKSFGECLKEAQAKNKA